MSQQIRVLQCVECSLYQVDLVKKTNKWECKVCGLKQMVHKEFFRGSGAECRAQVQHLNLEHGQKRQAQEERKILETLQTQASDSSSAEPVQCTKETSKWTKYVDEPIVGRNMTNVSTKMHSKQDVDEPETTQDSTRKPSDCRKRMAQNEFVVNKKPFSKWEKFL